MPHDAFMSYSHAADGELAPRLEHALERLAKPWYRRRALSVFRDTTGLSANPHLWAAICSELDQSRKFILLASPQAAASEWVGKELERWLETKPADDILIVLTEGRLRWDEQTSDFDREQSSAMPPRLFGAFAGEPLYVDLSWARTEQDLDLRHPEYRTAIARLAAPIHSRPGDTKSPDDLNSEDIRQHRRAVRLAVSAIGALCVLLAASAALGVAALVQRSEAIEQRDIAREQRQIARSRELAAQSTAQLPSDPELSTLLGIEAVQTYPSPRAMYALTHALDQARPVGTLAGDAAVDVVTFDADGGLLATADSSGTVRVWDVDAGSPVGEVRIASEEAATIWSAVFSPTDRNLIAFVDSGGTTTLWDLAANTVVWQEDWRPTSLAFSPDGTLLAGGHESNGVGVVTVKSADTGETERTLADHDLAVESVAFSPEGELLATASDDGTVGVWNIATGKEIQRLSGPPTSDGAPPYMLTLSFSADGKLLAAGGVGGTIVWSTREWAAVAQLPAATDVEFAPGAVPRLAAALSGSNGVVIRDILSGRSVRIASSRRVADVAFRRDGALAVPGVGRNVVLWDTFAEAKVLGGSEGHHYEPTAVSFSPDASTVVSGDAGGGLRLWNVSQGTLIEAIDGEDFLPPDWVCSAQLVADQTAVEVTYLGSQNIIWDLASGQPLERFGDFGTGTCPPGENETEALRRLPLPAGEVDSIRAVAVTADGWLVATAGADGVVRIWRSAGGSVVRTLEGHTGAINDIAFSDDGRLLATVGVDRTIRIWDVCQSCLQADDLLDLARSRVTRGLSREERERFSIEGAP
jgi:WD40 repeat protein